MERSDPMQPLSSEGIPEKDVSKIESELTKEIDRSQRQNRVNNGIAFGLSLIAVLASIIAGLSVAAQWFSTSTLAILSALPGAVLVVSKNFKFDEHSAWYRKKAYALKSLLYEF